MLLGENTPILLSCLSALMALASILCVGCRDLRQSAIIISALIAAIGFLTSTSETSASVFIIAALIVFAYTVFMYGSDFQPKAYRWGIAMFAVALLSAILYMLTKNAYFMLLTLAIMLPLFPLHGGYFSLLNGPPLTLSAFFSLLMPLIGLCGIFIFQTNDLLRPEALLKDQSKLFGALTVLSAAGCLYGSLRALASKKAPAFISYAGMALFSVLWLGAFNGAIGASSALTFAFSAGAVTAGLLLSWAFITARYGDLTIDALIATIGGISKSMPVFAAFLFFIILAAMGLPPFGLFTGFTGVLTDISAAASWPLAIVLFCWLLASWYFVKFMQKVLFGPRKNDFAYNRLSRMEGASLGIIIIILLILGLGSHKDLDLNAGKQTLWNNTKVKALPWKK